MKNVETSVKNGKLTIVIDLAKNVGPSATGKTIVLGTTAGNKPIALPDGQSAFLGVNCYRYPKESELS